MADAAHDKNGHPRYGAIGKILANALTAEMENDINGVALAGSVGGGASSDPQWSWLAAPAGIRPACGLPALRLRSPE